MDVGRMRPDLERREAAKLITSKLLTQRVPWTVHHAMDIILDSPLPKLTTNSSSWLARPATSGAKAYLVLP